MISNNNSVQNIPKTLVIIDEAEEVDEELNMTVWAERVINISPVVTVPGGFNLRISNQWDKFMDKEDSDTPIIVEVK